MRFLGSVRQRAACWTQARASRTCTCRPFSARRPPSMALKFGQTVVRSPSSGGKHSATVIFMHGLGDSGSGISSIGEALVMGAPQLSHIKFIFPTAPQRPVTMNDGAVMPAWFDLDFNKDSRIDSEGISSAIAYLEELVAAEVKSGTAPDRIAIGGFSQGGHVSLKYLFHAQQPPAACIALSTWLEPNPSQQAPGSSKGVKIFLGHGTADPLIPLPMATNTAAVLKGKGFTNVDFRQYSGMQHSTCPGELADMRKFLAETLPDRMPTTEQVDRMSVKELKAFLHSRSIDTRSMLEKSELVARAKAAL